MCLFGGYSVVERNSNPGANPGANLKQIFKESTYMMVTLIKAVLVLFSFSNTA